MRPPAGYGNFQRGSRMIEVRGVSKRFGGVRAVDDVSFSVAAGSITGLIGPNGAGKSTMFAVMAGFLKPSSGRVLFDGVAIEGEANWRTFRRGLVRTFQIPRPIRDMTVLENLMLVPQGQTGERLLSAWLRRGTIRREEIRLREQAREVLDFVGLRHLAQGPAGILSGGQLKLLELGRALMAQPRMVLLDEPAAGVNPALLAEIADRIARMNARGISFLIIEHNMELVMSLCSTVLVMMQGRLLMQGTPEEVQRDPRVLAAVLGGAPA
jgi:branched-chain amino acid transport system ATP-binding protein